jgi:hypothetical protein
MFSSMGGMPGMGGMVRCHVHVGNDAELTKRHVLQGGMGGMGGMPGGMGGMGGMGGGRGGRYDL